MPAARVELGEDIVEQDQRGHRPAFVEKPRLGEQQRQNSHALLTL